MFSKHEVNRVKVKSLEFKNLRTGLEIKKINFNDDITLLVGLSGAGKTQILNAIEYSLKLAVNKNIRLEPYHASIGIEIDGSNYIWEYCIEADKQQKLVGEDEEEYYFALERLTKENNILFERTENTISVMGYEKIPTPKRDESLLVQYAEDDNFKKIIAEIKKLYPIEVEVDVRRGIGEAEFGVMKTKINDVLKNNKETEFKVFSHLPIAIKVYIAKRYYEDIYYKIFEAVKELFIEIQDIDIVRDTAREMYLIAIKVYDKVLLQHEISNGMLKTIYYIVELFTMSENSLVLIDEFENGLGVNCIDLLSEMLITERKDLQFIITSHHPKIINGIPKEKWKIIDRNISVIENTGSIEYGVGNSQHDAYFNLLNRWEYEGKI